MWTKEPYSPPKQYSLPYPTDRIHYRGLKLRTSLGQVFYSFCSVTSGCLRCGFPTPRVPLNRPHARDLAGSEFL